MVVLVTHDPQRSEIRVLKVQDFFKQVKGIESIQKGIRRRR